MALPTPAEFAEKQVRRLQQSTADITAGVARVTEAPGARAAAKADKWAQGIQEAITSGKWQRRVAAVSLQDWKDSMTKVGIPRISQGAENNKRKVEAFAREFLPHLQAGMDAVNQMPDNTMEQRIQKAVRMMLHNAEFRRSA